MLACKYNVHETCQATRGKVALVNLIHGSHFSATETTYEVSQNVENLVESLHTCTRGRRKAVLSYVEFKIM